MKALLTSALLVAVAEIGDKTQLLSFVLAARLRKSGPIIAGIFAATILNHAAAAWFRNRYWSGWSACLSSVSACGPCHPDALGDSPRLHKAGVFVTAFVAFFLAEMGDKTQFATIALAARFDQLLPVILGTTAGMMLANVPAVWMGAKLAQKIPMNAVRLVAASLFIVVGIFTIWNPFTPAS